MNIHKKTINISCIFGTRPEAIKLAPVIIALKKDGRFSVDVCVTAQHRSMLDQVMDMFGIVPDNDLDIMKQDQSLMSLTVAVLTAVGDHIAQKGPDLIIVQGDTTSVLAASLAGFYHKIPIAHVEAGLRTGDKYSPYPEEMNRMLTSRIADLHFAPTDIAMENLCSEGIAEGKIFVTGNTVIDALLIAKKKVMDSPPVIEGLSEELLIGNSPIVLITGHRRESFGAGFESICDAILSLSKKFPKHYFIYPVHLNPNVQEPVRRILGSSPNVKLIDPVSYFPFIRLMMRAKLILTDSGGVQEEAPMLGIPVLVMRDHTERTEGITSGVVRLIGTRHHDIVTHVSELLSDEDIYSSMTVPTQLYGDGHASERIITHIAEYFNLENREMNIAL